MPRKLVHILSGAGAFVLPLISRGIALASIVAAALAASGMMALSAARPRWIGARSVLPLIRPHETLWNNGMIRYAIGVGLAIALLPPRSAGAGWIVLALGDGTATIVGRRLPIVRFRNGKSLGGALASMFLSVAGLALWSVFIGTAHSWPAPSVIALIMMTAAAGTLVELICLRDTDNLILPLLVGLIWELAHSVPG